MGLRISGTLRCVEEITELRRLIEDVIAVHDFCSFDHSKQECRDLFGVALTIDRFKEESGRAKQSKSLLYE